MLTYADICIQVFHLYLDSSVHSDVFELTYADVCVQVFQLCLDSSVHSDVFVSIEAVHFISEAVHTVGMRP